MEPGSERRLGLIKQTPRGQRRLKVAAITLNDRSGFELTSAVMPALGALKAVRPTQLDKRCSADFFDTESVEKIEQAHALRKPDHSSSHVISP